MPDGDDGLDVVQHPQLGTLKFPKDMPIQERNDSIDRLEMKTGSGMMQRATGQAQESIRSQIPTGPLKEETPHYTQKVTPGLKYDPYSPLQTTKEIGKTAKGELAAGGSLIAPEALPAMGIFGTAAATGGGAGVGTMIGQGATGENPFSADSLKESGINAALYGGGSLIGSLPAMRASIASKMYTPAGEFTPGAKAVTSLKPMLGVTGDTGDYIARKLFPEPAENVAERSAIANQGKIDEMGAARNKEVADWERLREQDAQSRMRRPEADPAELDQYGLPKNPDNPDIGPLYAKLPSTMPKIGAQGAGSPLIGAAPEEGGVAVIPEPRPLFPGENPNYAASVPRDELIGQARAAKPGAGTQLQQLGRPVIYRPRGVWDDQ